jgi:hypothetical protein
MERRAAAAMLDVRIYRTPPARALRRVLHQNGIFDRYSANALLHKIATHE